MDIVNTPYWVGQYILVLLGYLLIAFAWPHVVFQEHLRQKSPIYRFAFCISVQTVLINTAVLGLGLLHILNRWTVRALFYGLPLALVLWRLNRMKVDSTSFFHLVRISTCKLLVYRGLRALRTELRKVWRAVRPHFVEYLLLGGVCLYFLLYLSWGSFQTTSYIFSDQYVHHSWLYSLTQGKIFSAGVYPEAMHCLLLVIHWLFGVPTYSLILFFGSVEGAVFVIAAYCLFRELFHNRYTPIAAVLLFVLCSNSDGQGVKHALEGMSRLQATLPLEFALSTQMLCVLFLIRYLRYGREYTGEGKLSGYVLGNDLLVFTMSLAATIAAHFHPVIATFFLCLGVAAAYCKRVFSRRRFLPLAAAALSALLIVGLPMAAAWAAGTPLNSSLYWSIGLITGDEADGGAESDADAAAAEEQEDEEYTPSLKERLVYLVISFRAAFWNMLGLRRGTYVYYLTGPLLLLYAVFRLLLRFLPASPRALLDRRGLDGCWLDGYGLLLAILLSMFFLTTLPYLGLPSLTENTRVFTTDLMLYFALITLPLDFLLSCLSLALRGPLVHTASLACLVLIGSWAVRPENYHGYLYTTLSRYRADVAVANDIVRNYPRFKYTIVSPTEGIYHVNPYGRHEELLKFVKESAQERYFLPTDFVFIFIEKKPLYYAQNYFFSGPSWLALERYDIGISSQSPAVIAGEISWETAQKALPTNIAPFNLYKYLNNRSILESRGYYWCQAFSKLYPHEMHVYYEDDDFVCYYFQQEPHSPYNLAIDYEPT